MIIFDEGNKKEFTGEKKALDEFYKLHKKKFKKTFLNKSYQPDVILKKIY